MTVLTHRQIMGVEEIGVDDLLLAVLDDIAGDRLPLDLQLALIVDTVFHTVHGLADIAVVEDTRLLGQFKRSDTDLAHAVAVSEMIADIVKEPHRFLSDRRAARDHESDAVTEQIVAYFFERDAREQRTGCGIAELVAQLHRFLKFTVGLFPAQTDRLTRLAVDRLPKQRHGKQMGNVMAPNGTGDGLGLHILQLNEGARKERKPDIDRYQSEYMIKRQKGQQF